MEVDFSDYSLAELREARQTIDVYRYPDRVAELDQRIASQQTSTESIEEDQFQKYSTFGARFIAGIIDGFVITGLSLAIGFIILQVSENLADLVNVLDAFWLVAYSILLHGTFGQTIGKMITEVKVVDAATEKAINFKQAIIRDSVPLLSSTFVAGVFIMISYQGMTEDNSGLFINSLVVFTFVSFGWHILEIITMLLNSKRRAIHDFMAGTVVVNIQASDEKE